MITVNEAENQILKQVQNFGTEKVGLELSLGRVLAQSVLADRDYPPFNRATMDGIAIFFDNFAKGQRTFQIKAVQTAGQTPIEVDQENQCIQIMTGAAVPDSLDTVIPIEDLVIKNNLATIVADSIGKGQFIHSKGSDKQKGDLIVNSGCRVTSDILPILASVGLSSVVVSKLPKVAIITTGDELVDPETSPTKFQIRRSNDLAIWAVLKQYSLEADQFHLPDEKNIIRKSLEKSLKTYDIILISGGVSKGEFDFVQNVLTELSVKKVFHGVSQKPGKPLWFGTHTGGARIFALPGNPVSAYLCLLRYFVPWLRTSLRLEKKAALYAVLETNIISSGQLTQFVQVKLHTNTSGQLLAKAVAHNGSGDFMSLVVANAFVELPSGKTVHKKGSVHQVWPFKSI